LNEYLRFRYQNDLDTQQSALKKLTISWRIVHGSPNMTRIVKLLLRHSLCFFGICKKMTIGGVKLSGRSLTVYRLVERAWTLSGGELMHSAEIWHDDCCMFSGNQPIVRLRDAG